MDPDRNEECTNLSIVLIILCILFLFFLYNLQIQDLYKTSVQDFDLQVCFNTHKIVTMEILLIL